MNLILSYANIGRVYNVNLNDLVTNKGLPCVDNLPHSSTMIGHKDPRKYTLESYRYFCGLSIGKCWEEIFQMELLLDAVKPVRIVELGTGEGTFTLFLQLYAAINDMQLYTYDITENMPKKIRDLVTPMGIHYEIKDVFKYIPEIGAIIQQEGITLLYCDNGDKPREMREWGPYCKLNDILVVHDLDTCEVQYSDVEYLLKRGFIKFSPEWQKTFKGSMQYILKKKT